MKVKFFNPGLGFTQKKDEMLGEIERVLTAGDLILRGDVEKFEKSVADYVGTKYCVALNSCTDALYLALRALKIGQGDEVLVPSRTFVASAQVIVQVGATPVYYDLGSDLRSLVSDKTVAIIPVHIEGHIDDHFGEILDIADDLDLYVIEDSAQAFGATFEGKKAGSIGDAGAFSFYPAKTLGAYGDAGALVTNNEDIYNYVKDCRNHFKDDARDWGVNSRLDNLQAAILNVKFKYYDKALERRKEIAEMYQEFLGSMDEKTGLKLPPHTQGRIWQDYIIRTDRRDELYTYLKEKGVETLKNNYPFPVPKLPQAQKYEDETLRLPCNELLTNEEVQYVIDCIIEFYV